LLALLYAAIPWIIFFLIFTYGNVSNFGDPFVTYGALNTSHTKVFDTSSFFLIEFEAIDFENVIQYSKYLLPYLFAGIFNNVDNNFESSLGQNWIGFIPLIALGLIFIISYKSKNKRLEIFVMALLLFGIVWFYSSITSEYLAEKGVPGRYILPAFVFSSMIFGYAAERLFVGIGNKKWNISKILQLSLVSVVFVFVLISFSFTPAVTMFGQGDFRNPFDYERSFPLKDESINEKSILVTPNGSRALEYNVIPFNPYASGQLNIELLNSVIQDYNAFVFKTPYTMNEIEVLHKLEKNGFVLIEHSENFCSLKSDTELLKPYEKCSFNKPIKGN
jgi:hypothetical protein